MSDVSVRDAARRFAASGTVDDEARLLRARVRAGRLAIEWVRVCAYLGDGAARRLLGADEGPTFSLGSVIHVMRPPRPWCRLMRFVPKRPLVASLVNVLEVARSATERVVPWRGFSHPAPTIALAVVRGWLDEPEPVRTSGLDDASKVLSGARVDGRDDPRTRALLSAVGALVDIALARGTRLPSATAAALQAASVLSRGEVGATRDLRPLEAVFTTTLIRVLLA